MVLIEIARGSDFPEILDQKSIFWYQAGFLGNTLFRGTTKSHPLTYLITLN
jgi:hypothetical protein